MLVLLAASLCLATGLVCVQLGWPRGDGLRSHALLKLSLAAGYGLGIFSVNYSLCLFVAASRAALVAVDLAAFGLLAALAASRRGPRDTLDDVVVHAAGRRRWLDYGLVTTFALALAGALYVTVVSVIRQPHGTGWDAIAIWNLRARIMFRGGALSSEGFPPTLLAQSDYPLLLPAAIAHLWTYLGTDSPAVPALLALTSTFGTVGLLYSAIRVLRGRNQALLAGTVLLGTPFFVEHGTSQYADVPLGFFLLATTALLCLDDRLPRGSVGLLPLAGLAAALAGWTKNEGLLFLLAVLGAHALVASRRTGWTVLWRRMSVFLGAGLPVLLLLAYFKIRIAPPGGLFTGWHGILQRASDPGRYGLIARWFSKEFLAFGQWALVPGSLVLLAYAWLAGIETRRDRPTGVLTAALALALTVAGYWAVYVITPYDLEWHLRFSLDRLFTQLWPSVVLLFFMILRTPEEAIVAGPPRGSAEVARARGRVELWARRWSFLLPLALACVPPTLVVSMVARYSVNVPFWDEFLLVPLLRQAFEGRLRLDLLWELHNEHRPLLPRLMMLALARVSGWDIRYELVANIVVALALLAALALLITRTLRPLAPSLRPWLILAASLLTFSPAQGENWLWGFQLVILMNALAATLTVFALVHWAPRWPGIAIALLAAVGGTLCFASGLLLLVLVPVWLILRHRHAASWLALAVVVIVPASVIALYFVGFVHPGSLPSSYHLFGRPLAYGGYVLTYMGAPLTFDWSTTIAASWGVVGVGGFTACAVRLWRRSAPHRQALLPWLALGLYAALTAFLTGVGRVGLGVDQALAPRYVTLSALFWLGLLVVAALAVGGGSIVIRSITACVLALGAVSYALAWTSAGAGAESRRTVLVQGRECLIHYERAPEECLRLLYPSADIVRDAARELERLALGPFAPNQKERALSSYTVVGGPGPTGTAGFIDVITVTPSPAPGGGQRFGEVRAAGWALDPFARRTAAAVLVVVDGRVMGRARTGQPRPDVSKVSRRSRSGWELRFGSFRLEPGPHLVEAYAVLEDDRRIIRLQGARMIEISR